MEARWFDRYHSSTFRMVSCFSRGTTSASCGRRADEERAEDVACPFERLHQAEGEGDPARGLVRGKSRVHPVDPVGDAADVIARHRAMPRGVNACADTGSVCARSTSTSSDHRWKRRSTGRVSKAHWAMRLCFSTDVSPRGQRQDAFRRVSQGQGHQFQRGCSGASVLTLGAVSEGRFDASSFRTSKAGPRTIRRNSGIDRMFRCSFFNARRGIAREGALTLPPPLGM